MVPRISKTGRSFKGAAQYFLHDKQAETMDRVAYVELLNLPTDDPKRAVAHMIDTAEHSDQLKLAAGFKAAKTKAKPVYSFSLAWHPSEKPTKEEQLQAAHDTIKRLDLTEHQAMIVAHNDTDHPHVHVIVNRIHPENGLAKVMSKDRIKLSEWALEYDKVRGNAFCPMRQANNDERAKGNWVKDDSLTRKQHYTWKKQESDKIWAEYKAEKEAAHEKHKPSFDALWQQKQERLAARKKEIKAAMKPAWAAMFKEQRKDLKDFENRFTKRLSFALTHAKYQGHRLKAVLRAFTTDEGQKRHYMQANHDTQRKELANHQSQIIGDASREITKAWKYDRDTLLASVKQEGKDRLEHYKDVSEKVWETPTNERKPAQKARLSFEEAERAMFGDETIENAQREVRKRAKRERNRSRGDNTGRKFTPD